MSERLKRRQFTLKSLLLSTSFIGAGIGCYFAGSAYLSAGDRSIWWRPVFGVLQIIGAGPLVGAGLFEPFRRARLGAYLGFFAPLIAVFCYFIIRFGWQPVWEDFTMRVVIALTGFAIVLTAFSTVRTTWKWRSRKSTISESPRLD